MQGLVGAAFEESEFLLSLEPFWNTVLYQFEILFNIVVFFLKTDHSNSYIKGLGVAVGALLGGVIFKIFGGRLMFQVGDNKLSLFNVGWAVLGTLDWLMDSFIHSKIFEIIFKSS